MIVPLLVGAILNTIDKAHLAWIEGLLQALGTTPVEDPATGEAHFEFLEIGGFASSLAGRGATTLIAMFLVCVASQMNFRVGGRAIKKGAIITVAKLAVAIGCGYLIAAGSDEFDGWLGLSIVAIIAAMSNGNGGLYLALTGEYGDRSDVGAVSVISLNDGPFFTLLALGLMGERFPFVAFLAVLLPMIVGFVIGQVSPAARQFLAPGEKLAIPFFAFALGTTMNFWTFLDLEVLVGGLFLGVATVVLTGTVSTWVLSLLGEKRTIAGYAEASTAGNAVQTPLAIALAAGGGVAAEGVMTARAEAYQQLVPIATAQISIAVMTTALLCPLAVMWWNSRLVAGAAADESSGDEVPATDAMPDNEAR